MAAAGPVGSIRGSFGVERRASQTPQSPFGTRPLSVTVKKCVRRADVGRRVVPLRPPGWYHADMSPEQTSNTPTNGSTSSSLIRRAQRRDPEAWRRLVDLYGPLVFYWCRRGGLASPDAADVFQEVFASVSASLERFSPQREGTFRGWLWTITRNKLRDHYRHHANEAQAAGGTDAYHRLAELPDQWPGDSVDPRDRSEIQSLYRRALDLVRSEFEERTWQAFWRSVIEGQDTAQVAAGLGLTPNAVRQYKSRVLRRLRRELGDVSE